MLLQQLVCVHCGGSPPNAPRTDVYAYRCSGSDVVQQSVLVISNNPLFRRHFWAGSTFTHLPLLQRTAMPYTFSSPTADGDCAKLVGDYTETGTWGGKTFLVKDDGKIFIFWDVDTGLWTAAAAAACDVQLAVAAEDEENPMAHDAQSALSVATVQTALAVDACTFVRSALPCDCVSC